MVVNEHNYGDIYYSKTYGKLYESIEKGDYFIFEYTSSFGSIIYPFIKRPVPYLVGGRQYYDIVTPYGYGGPLIVELSSDSEKCDAAVKFQLMADFLQAFRQYCNEQDIIAEFIRFHVLYNNALYLPVDNTGYQVLCNRQTIAVDLLDPNFFMTQFDSKCRNMVRKAEKLGVAIEVDTMLDTIDTFADIYYETMTKDAADEYYFFSTDYFHRIRDELKNSSLLINAIYEDQTIASSLFLYTPGGYAHYHLSATKPAFYKLAANNLILKTACDALRSNNCSWLHLGGGLRSSTDDGLYLFKRSFGRMDKNVKYFYIGKKIWNGEAYEQVMEAYLSAGGERNSFFPEYRGKKPKFSGIHIIICVI